MSASFYVNSDEAPFPEIDVICRLKAAASSPELAINYTGQLFDALCGTYDADVLGVSLPLASAWSEYGDRVVALIGFELLPVLGVNPVERMAEMTASIAADLPAELTVLVPGPGE
ncbi:MAG: hypothetical protein WKF96_25110 [Solirubrobacteraceae bacterium]